MGDDMGIPAERVRRIIREEIVLEAAHRFRATLEPEEWDPERSHEKERELRPDNFGIGSDGRMVLLNSSIF